MTRRPTPLRSVALAAMATMIALLGPGCRTRPSTQISLEVDSDLRPPGEIDRVEVRVLRIVGPHTSGPSDPGTCDTRGPVARHGYDYLQTFCRSFDLDSTVAGRPLVQLGVIPGSPEAIDQPVALEAVAYLDGVEVVPPEFAHTRFRRDENRDVFLFLARACADVDCPEGQTCRMGTCQAPELPDDPDAGVRPDAGLPDDSGSLPPVDAAASLDASGCVATTDCPPASPGAWSACAFDDECDQDGTHTRTVTTHPCAGGVCGTATTMETGPCSRDTDGDPCAGGTTVTPGTCGGFASTCDETGTRSVHTVQRACGGGSCIVETFDGTEACARSTTGDMCGATTTTRGTCTFSSTCVERGTRAVTVTERFCAGGACQTDPIVGSESCTRADTHFDPCGGTTMCPFQCSATEVCEPVCRTGCAC